MGLTPLSLQKIDSEGDTRDSTAEERIMYSVVGLAAGIEIIIYQKMGKWWVTGTGSYVQGSFASANAALSAVSVSFSARKRRAD